MSGRKVLLMWLNMMRGIQAAWPFLAAAFAVVLLLIPPVGNFPLNDDWIFASEVRTLLETGRYVHHMFAAPTVVAQTFWGAAFAWAFGFSYTVLRVSTLATAFAAVCAVAACARECGARRPVSVLCGLTLLFNPIFLNLAYTFNTDVPFLAPLAGSVFFYLRAIRTNQGRDIALGSALSALAFLVRQFGVLSSAAFAFLSVFRLFRQRRLPRRAELLALGLPWLLTGCFYLALKHSQVQGYAWRQENPVSLSTDELARVWDLFIVMLVYLGFFTLPLTFGRFVQILRNRAWAAQHWLLFALLAVFIGDALLGRPSHEHALPYLRNILGDLHGGVVTLGHQGYAAPTWSIVRLGNVWIFLTVLAAGSVSLLLVEVASIIKEEPLSGNGAGPSDTLLRTVFLLACAGLLLCALFNPWMHMVSDRYLLPPALVTTVLVIAVQRPAPTGNRAMLAAAAPVLAAMAILSLVCLQDYLAWNTARWKATAYLLNERRVHPWRIEAGYEYQGVYTSAECLRRHHSADFWRTGTGDWWVLDRSYVVALWPRPGYRVIREFPYYSYLGRNDLPLRRSPVLQMGERKVLVLEKEGPMLDPSLPPPALATK